MDRWVLLVVGFMVFAITVWVILLSSLGNNECPDKLTSDYLACDGDVDCYFHPKYECISINKNLDCIIKEDLSARQEIARLFQCYCINSKCVTQMIRD
ncbi:MAG: hypothetical protein WC307_03780 [Candidatus Nanoarchaeia archaeon]|jgi:hypothetical protein